MQHPTIHWNLKQQSDSGISGLGLAHRVKDCLDCVLGSLDLRCKAAAWGFGGQRRRSDGCVQRRHSRNKFRGQPPESSVGWDDHVFLTTATTENILMVAGNIDSHRLPPTTTGWCQSHSDNTNITTNRLTNELIIGCAKPEAKATQMPSLWWSTRSVGTNDQQDAKHNGSLPSR